MKTTFRLGASLSVAMVLLTVATAQDAAQAAGMEDILHPFRNIRLGVDSRARLEWWNGLYASSVPDSSYDFWNLRVRPYAEYSSEHLQFFFQLQYAGGFGLPENAGGGPGHVYYSLNKEENPQAVDVLELYADVRDFPLNGLNVRMGRQGLKGGEEVLYKDQEIFDWLKKNRLSERLVGTWDWTNVGRRYDAVNASYGTKSFLVNGFASRVLSGGFEYEDAFQSLDNVEVYGLSLTLKRNTLIRNTEIRFYGYYYYDNRDVAKEVTGGTMKLNTVGASVVGVYPGLGPGILDALLWGGFQSGDYGQANQRAYAVVAELGYQIPDLMMKPWLRTGVAYGSGDNDPSGGDHKTFFDMTPTNHKYYGSMDTSALSNLINAYLQLYLKPMEKVLVHMEGLFFWLAEPNDSWYGGSGPSNEQTFGYAGGYNVTTGQTERLTGGRRFIGSEIDFSVKYDVTSYFNMVAGYSHFFADEGAERVFPAKPDGDWIFVQAALNF